MSEYSKRAMLRAAVDRLGMEILAVRLGSPASLLEAWMQGMATMPERKYLALVDLLADLGDQPPKADK